MVIWARVVVLETEVENLEKYLGGKIHGAWGRMGCGWVEGGKEQ